LAWQVKRLGEAHLIELDLYAVDDGELLETRVTEGRENIAELSDPVFEHVKLLLASLPAPSAPDVIVLGAGEGSPFAGDTGPEPADGDASVVPVGGLDYYEFERKRNGGIGLMAIGIVGIIAAFGLGFGAGYTGNDVLLYAAIGVEVLGHVLLLPGIVMTVKGHKGMKVAPNRPAGTALENRLVGGPAPRAPAAGSLLLTVGASGLTLRF
jgi:hypothetical protein